MKKLITILIIGISNLAFAGDYLGDYTNNPYNPNRAASPNGYVAPRAQYQIQTFGTNSPKLYDKSGNYRGKLSNNPYGPESVSNPYGRYGSPYSQESINNPYGAGSPYRMNSPTNPYGEGWKIIK